MLWWESGRIERHASRGTRLQRVSTTRILLWTTPIYPKKYYYVTSLSFWIYIYKVVKTNLKRRNPWIFYPRVYRGSIKSLDSYCLAPCSNLLYVDAGNICDIWRLVSLFVLLYLYQMGNVFQELFFCVWLIW